jgi:hypothetical protein
MANDHTRPTSDTRAEEAEEAQRAHTADRPPTEEEAEAADRNPLDPAVAESFKEAAERGAAEKGEGRIP